MKTKLENHIITREEVLLLIQRLVSKIEDVTDEIDKVQLERLEERDETLAGIRAELDGLTTQIAEYVNTLAGSDSALSDELSQIKETLSESVFAINESIGSSVVALSEQIDSVRKEIPVVREKTREELLAVIGPNEEVAELKEEIEELRNREPEEQIDYGEDILNAFMGIEEVHKRIDELPDYDSKLKELNTDMHKLSTELVNILPRVEVFASGVKVGSAHRLNFVGSTVSFDNGLVTVTNTGSSSATWTFYATTWSVEPTLNTSLAGGDVFNYTLDGVTRYRYVPNTYDASEDAFYATFSNPTLSGLIVARG